MEIKSLKGKEICDIIKTCANAGVSNLKIGDFEVAFGEHKKSQEESITAPVEGTQAESFESGKIEAQTPQDNEEFVDVLQQRVREDLAHAQTLIDNPIDFEQSIIDGFIRGDNDDSQEFGRAEPALSGR